MEFKNKAPKWDAAGAEPTLELQTSGFVAGYKPPASYFNYLFYTYTKCINELQAFLKENEFLPISGGELTNELIVNENFQVRRTFDGIPYRSYLRPINYSIGGNGEYSTGLIHYHNGVNNAQLFFNKDGVILRDNVNGKAYHVFGQYNTDLIKNVCLPLDASKPLTGELNFKRTENGYATVYKNHGSGGASDDYGMILRDTDINGKAAAVVIRAKDNAVRFRDNANTYHELHGGHNKPTGTYSGNGKSNHRDINTGGIGDLLLINSTGYSVLVSKTGAVVMKAADTTGGNATRINWLDVSFENGVLKIESTNDAINKSGVTYTYQVL